MFDFLLRLAAQLEGFPTQLVIVCLTLLAIVYRVLWGAEPKEVPDIIRALADLFGRKKID